MTSKLGKFELTFVFWGFVVTTTNFLQKLVVNRTTAANFCGVTLSRYGHANEGTNGRFRTRSRSRIRI